MSSSDKGKAVMASDQGEGAEDRVAKFEEAKDYWQKKYIVSQAVYHTQQELVAELTNQREHLLQVAQRLQRRADSLEEENGRLLQEVKQFRKFAGMWDCRKRWASTSLHFSDPTQCYRKTLL